MSKQNEDIDSKQNELLNTNDDPDILDPNNVTGGNTDDDDDDHKSVAADPHILDPNNVTGGNTDDDDDDDPHILDPNNVTGGNTDDDDDDDDDDRKSVAADPSQQIQQNDDDYDRKAVADTIQDTLNHIAAKYSVILKDKKQNNKMQQYLYKPVAFKDKSKNFGLPRRPQVNLYKTSQNIMVVLRGQDWTNDPFVEKFVEFLNFAGYQRVTLVITMEYVRYFRNLHQDCNSWNLTAKLALFRTIMMVLYFSFFIRDKCVYGGIFEILYEQDFHIESRSKKNEINIKLISKIASILQKTRVHYYNKAIQQAHGSQPAVAKKMMMNQNDIDHNIDAFVAQTTKEGEEEEEEEEEEQEEEEQAQEEVVYSGSAINTYHQRSVQALFAINRSQQNKFVKQQQELTRNVEMIARWQLAFQEQTARQLLESQLNDDNDDDNDDDDNKQQRNKPKLNDDDDNKQQRTKSKLIESKSNDDDDDDDDLAYRPERLWYLIKGLLTKTQQHPDSIPYSDVIELIDVFEKLMKIFCDNFNFSQLMFRKGYRLHGWAPRFSYAARSAQFLWRYNQLRLEATVNAAKQMMKQGSGMNRVQMVLLYTKERGYGRMNQTEQAQIKEHYRRRYEQVMALLCPVGCMMEAADYNDPKNEPIYSANDWVDEWEHHTIRPSLEWTIKLDKIETLMKMQTNLIDATAMHITDPWCRIEMVHPAFDIEAELKSSKWIDRKLKIEGDNADIRPGSSYDYDYGQWDNFAPVGSARYGRIAANSYHHHQHNQQQQQQQHHHQQNQEQQQQQQQHHHQQNQQNPPTYSETVRGDQRGDHRRGGQRGRGRWNNYNSN